MILILAVKFRKCIAFFLLGIFYAQMLLANSTAGGLAKNVMAGRVYPPIFSLKDIFDSVNKDYKYFEKNNSNIIDSPFNVSNPVAANNDVKFIENKKIRNEQLFSGGPTQPEMQAFQSVNSNNMVDLFTGDFSYNIPLLDVGGYPVNIAYHGGGSADEEASWVGLNWNINPGSITRNMRGVPDDFNGGADTIQKVSSIKSNVNVGITLGANFELTGFPLPVTIGPSVGIFHNTYNGWGLETALNASINAGSHAQGPLSGGLTVTNNSQNGLTLNPSLSAKTALHNASNNGSGSFGVQISAAYNSRSGLKEIQMGLNASAKRKNKSASADNFAGLSFAWPTYNPSISIPTTNYNFSFTAKLGGEVSAFHPNFFISGYGGREYIAAADTSLSLPVFGYLNLQNMGSNWSALTDYNREKEMPYREKPAIPHIAVPSYTYDVFSISGEGTGGSFRAYRGDIGFVADHFTKSKTISAAASIDFGAGNLVHGGVDLNANYAVTQSGPWLSENPLRSTIAFRKSDGLYEAAYFRNPAEKAINTTAFYNALGGDDVVAPVLYQSSNSSPTILATNSLTRFSGKKAIGTIALTPASAVRNTRDKRSQVISYLSAKEADVAGLSKYIEDYTVNQFGLHYCQNDAPEDAAGKGTGLLATYFKNTSFQGSPAYTRLDTNVYFNWAKGSPFAAGFPADNFSVRWLGRLKAPVTGTYAFGTYTDDGIRIWMNDSLILNDWTIHAAKWDTCRVNLVEGELYNFKVEYFEGGGNAGVQLAWRRPDQTNHSFNPLNKDIVPAEFLFPPVFTDTAVVTPILTREDRVNNFRKSSHLSEIDVLNPDGRRYVYGIPVYNLKQKEVSFAVNSAGGNQQTGLTAYQHGIDNSTKNTNGKDGYYSKEEIPAYAHSFLLTGILSGDYVDVTGNGISDDDIGDAVRFDYSKTSGIANPFEWRAPYITDSANYNEGLKSYNRDDKAHYIYGKKELWYLHSIESKTMVANFTLQSRADLLEIDERGNKQGNGKAMCLKQIDLYSKADFQAHGASAIPVKTVHFEYSYELCRGINRPVNDSGKLTLKRIWFTYNGNNKGELNPYVFVYNSNNPRYNTNIADKWGTYKSPLQNPGATVDNSVSNAEYPYSLQDSLQAAGNAAAWMLDSIKLPSGGRIKVKYESDDYAYVQNRRAMKLFKLAGFGTDSTGSYNNKLHASSTDQLYVYVKVPFTVSSNRELYARYLDGIGKLYFRLFIKMPPDDFGKGSEYIPCYADPDLAAGRWYGKVDSHTIWIKIKGVNKTGDGNGSFSPLSQTAINFLRLNLPSKAYPGAEVNDELNLKDVITIIGSMVGNVVTALAGFTNTAHVYGWATETDTSRSFVRLNAPDLKKYGGGLRVKSVLIYDNWNAMTGRRESVYGQNYIYTTTQNINGVPSVVSSGVASWEPSIGGDENPFHLPIEYVDRASVLAPAATLYTEEPLGEAFYPGAAVGYSKVRVRTIHADKTRSANGYAETSFYTSYDFPTTWDWSMLDNNTKKRYKPLLNNFLRINAKNYLSLSQGFKVELNDMNGKMRSEATYGETDPVHPISYTENFYRVDNASVQFKHLSNTVTTIDPLGNIDTLATIGKDVELMTDMRDQTSTSVGGNINVNVDLFAAGILPIAIPSLLNLYQQETNQFRSVAMIKVVQRYGILDSVVHIEKGSKITSQNLLYDSETGDPLLVKTKNEFNDPLYEFTYPTHWAYSGTGPAYQNIGALLNHLTVRNGKITAGLLQPDSNYFTAGDELLVYSKQTTSIAACNYVFASFPNDYRLWVIDSNVISGGPKRLFMLDKDGTPFTGNDVTLKVTRSGHRNMNGSVGSISSLGNPLLKDGTGIYHLVFDTSTRVLSAGAMEMQQDWKVADKHRSNIFTSCISTSLDSAQANAEACSCLKPFFDYLVASHSLFVSKASHTTVNDIITAAAAAGYPVSTGSCPMLSANASLPFYALSADNNASIYMARIGNEIINLRSRSGLPVSFYNLKSSSCASGKVVYKDSTIHVPTPDTVTVKLTPKSVNLISSTGLCPTFLDSLILVDSVSDHLLTENNLDVGGQSRNAIGIMRFDQIRDFSPQATVLSAKLILQADSRGHYPPQWTNANSVNPVDSINYSLSAPAGWFAYQPLDTMLYQSLFSSWYKGIKKSTAFQNDTIDVKDYVNGYIEGTYAANSFVLTQGSADLHLNWQQDSAEAFSSTIPKYLSGGYNNYYATYYSERYSDSSKWPSMYVTYIVPPVLTDTLGAVLEYNATVSCSTIYGRQCYSSITDTVVNPYQTGLLGNFRPQRNYAYYGQRKEADPAVTTNIRTNGTIKSFAPFWTLQGGRWAPAYDSTRWVWNSQSTLFNRKGFELENKDPLGRYNAGLYGYGLTMPTAVIQNSHNREAAFDGFEDYGFLTNSCDSTCAETRPFDFSFYQTAISTAAAHTGLYSLRIPKDSIISMPFPVQTAVDSDKLQLGNTVSNDSCLGSQLKGITTSAKSLLPSFTPSAGKKMIVSAWVKEDSACACTSYTNNHLLVSFITGSEPSTLTLSPSGTLVEGWQRYEAVVNIPENATQMVLNLQASFSAVTYFDDIRIHPYSAQMKSYAYNAVNLRLMAELDENNYATFYEYDDDGTLIRVKKETERGVKTIKETRSALLKNQ